MKKNKNLEENLYLNLKEQVLNLEKGSKINSLRELSIKYNLNLNIILKIVKKLENEGYLYSQKGKGYFTKEKNSYSIYTKEKEEIKNNTLMKQIENEDGIINFNMFIPRQNEYFLKQYKNLLSKILKTTNLNLFAHHDIQGLDSLIELIGSLIEKGNSLFIKKDNIVITSSLSTAYMTIARVFSNNENDLKPTIAMTNPSFPRNYNLLKSSFHIKFFDLQNNGWDLNEFEKFLKKEKVAFVDITTTYHIPTGITWSEKKKKRLLDLANKYDFYIVEDDSYSDFFYYRRVSALKSIERMGEERVIYLKSHSKYLSPEFELAIVIVPPILREKLLYAKYYIDENTSVIKQKSLEELLKLGIYEEFFRKKKKELKTKYETILKLISEIDDMRLTRKPNGGFFIWLDLPEWIDVNEYYKECQRKGVIFIQGKAFYFQGYRDNEIGINFLTLTLEEIIQGISIMKRVLLEFKARNINGNN